MLGCKTNDLVRHSSNHGEQNDAGRKACSEGGERDQHVEADRNEHHGHEKTGAASRMEGRILLHNRGFERITILKGKDRLVLGAVIFVHPANIFPERDAPDEKQEEDKTDGSVNQVEDDASSKSGIDFLQLG